MSYLKTWTNAAAEITDLDGWPLEVDRQTVEDCIKGIEKDHAIVAVVIESVRCEVADLATERC